MTSLPAAPVRTTLVEAPHPVDLSVPRTVVVPVPVANDAIARNGVRTAARNGVRTGARTAAGRRVMSAGLPVQVLAGVSGGARAGRIVAQIVVRVAGQNVRASGVAPC